MLVALAFQGLFAVRNQFLTHLFGGLQRIVNDLLAGVFRLTSAGFSLCQPIFNKGIYGRLYLDAFGVSRQLLYSRVWETPRLAARFFRILLHRVPIPTLTMFYFVGLIIVGFVAAH